MVPWCAEAGSKMDNSPISWQLYVADLEEQAVAEWVTPQEQQAVRVAQGRLFRLHQVSRALTSKSSTTKAMTTWRNRNRTLWTESGPSDGADDAHEISHRSKRAEEDIAEIRAQAASRADARAVARAARMENWAEDNFAAIRRLCHRDDQRTIALPWPTIAPSQRGRPTVALRQGPRSHKGWLPLGSDCSGVRRVRCCRLVLSCCCRFRARVVSAPAFHSG